MLKLVSCQLLCARQNNESEETGQRPLGLTGCILTLKIMLLCLSFIRFLFGLNMMGNLQDDLRF